MSNIARLLGSCLSKHYLVSLSVPRTSQVSCRTSTDILIFATSRRFFSLSEEFQRRRGKTGRKALRGIWPDLLLKPLGAMWRAVPWTTLTCYESCARQAARLDASISSKTTRPRRVTLESRALQIVQPRAPPCLFLPRQHLFDGRTQLFRHELRHIGVGAHALDVALVGGAGQG